MKKVILAIVLVIATMAQAGMVGDTSIAYGKVKAEASVAGYSASMNTNVTSIRTDLGYDFGNIRTLGYIQMDKYSDDVISDTEGNAISYGIEVDYVHAVNSETSVFIGGLIGKGYKDLGSQGDSVGVGSADFRDTAVRGGIIYDIGKIDIKAGLEYKKRDYDTIVVGGYTVELDEAIQSVFIGIDYKF